MSMKLNQLLVPTTALTLISGVTPLFLVAVFHGFTRHYAIHSDADIIYVYEALRLNAGMGQRYFDHTGYWLFVPLAWWFKGLSFLGFIGVDALDQLPELKSPEFEPTYAKLVFAARYLSVILSGIFVALFFLLRIIGKLPRLRDWFLP